MGIKFDYNLKKEETIRAFQRVLFKSVLKMHEIATRKVPVNIGILKGSISFFPKTLGVNKYNLTAGAAYAGDVEFGTRPHYVSAKHLQGWASKKLGDPKLAYAVAANIAKFGTNAQPYLRPALNEVKQLWVKRFFNEEFA